MKNFTIMDIKEKDFIPNWVKQWNSRNEAIEGVLNYMKTQQSRFDALGFQGIPVKRKKK